MNQTNPMDQTNPNQTKTSPINIDSHFKTLMHFRTDCQNDARLTPAAQLLFRLLVEQANFSRWTDTFTYPIDEISRVSHLARQTIVDCRRLLKNLGYINFSGNPSRYTVYSLVDCGVDYSGTPTPPSKNKQTKTKEERKERRKGETPHASNANNSPNDRSNLAGTETELQAAIKERLKTLGY